MEMVTDRNMAKNKEAVGTKDSFTHGNEARDVIFKNKENLAEIQLLGTLYTVGWLTFS